jgi:hypothetical protein
MPFDDGEAALHLLARLQEVEQRQHGDMRRDLVLTRLDGLGRRVDHYATPEQPLVVDDALLPSAAWPWSADGATRDDDVLGLVERPAVPQQLVAKPQRGHPSG